MASDRYISSVKRCNNLVDEITNNKTKKLCKEFLDSEINTLSKNTFISTNFYYASFFREMKDIDLDAIEDSFIYKQLCKKRDFAVVALKFFSKIYTEEQSAVFNANRYKYKYLIHAADYELFKEMSTGETKPEHVIYVNTQNLKKQKNLRFMPKRTTQYISELISEFLNQRKACTLRFDFPATIAEYLFDNNITDIYEQINDDLIGNFFDTYTDRFTDFYTCAKDFFIWILDTFDKDTQLAKCPLYRVNILDKITFTTFAKQGFKPVLYNKFDKVPTPDGWFIIPNGAESGSTQLTANSVVLADFREIKNNYIRECVKSYVWNSTINLSTTVKNVHSMMPALNMIFPEVETEYDSLDSVKCANYKSWVLTAYPITETRNNKIYPFLNFVKYVDQNKLLNVDKNCYLYLDNKGSINQQGAKGVPVEDLKKIAIYFDEHKMDNYDSLAYYVIFHICLNTEFRISQIVSLPIDCVHESMKKNEYVIVSNTKVGGYQTVEQPCAKIVKKIIDDYLKETAEYREQCPSEDVKKHLFITKNEYNGVYACISRPHFTEYINKACESLGLPSWTAKNLRATYITNAKEYILKNNLSDMTLLGITGHRSVDMINNHYIQEKIRDALQATNNIIIGDVDITGQIVKDKAKIKSGNDVSVENECGYCQSEFCDLNGSLSCLLCKHFATTVDRIPFFKKQIKELDDVIAKGETRHDIEDAVNLKRLFARYLEALMNLKEEANAKN